MQEVQGDRWQPSGNASETYEKYLVPAIFGVWPPILLRLVSPRPGERVLDVACGTGTVSRLAAEQVGPQGKVVGLDISGSMLAVARSIPSPAGQIEWKEGDALSIPFTEGSFAIMNWQLGLQFFPDKEKAMEGMKKIFDTGGHLALLGWRPILHSLGVA